MIERWLQKELRLSSTEAHEAAEGFEAGFTPLLLDRLYDSLGRPQTCPHGNPIPAKGGHMEMDYDGVYLNEVVAGERVVIGRITEEAEADLDLLTYLERNGVGPNVALTILAVDRMSGAVTAVTGAGKEIRLEGRSAALIWARRAEDAGAQPEAAPGAIPDAAAATRSARTGGTSPVPA